MTEVQGDGNRVGGIGFRDAAWVGQVGTGQHGQNFKNSEMSQRPLN